jgi:hypothetical protein
MKCAKCREEYESETYPCSCPKCYPPAKGRTFLDDAKDLIGRLPHKDDSELLRQLTGSYLMDYEYGNKREQRVACDFLNLLQSEAIKLQPRRTC